MRELSSRILSTFGGSRTPSKPYSGYEVHACTGLIGKLEKKKFAIPLKKTSSFTCNLQPATCNLQPATCF